MSTMQERTYEMLKRLIKTEILGKEEVSARVAFYLKAQRINVEQAENLYLLIEEVYGEDM